MASFLLPLLGLHSFQKTHSSADQTKETSSIPLAPLPSPITTTISGPVVPVSIHAHVTTYLSDIPTTSTSLPVSATGSVAPCQNIQHSFHQNTGNNPSRADAVKKMYLAAWHGYEKYALGADELLPLSATGINKFYGWGLTIVEALDTAIVMNLTDIVTRQLTHVANVDFTSAPNVPLDCFDTNIRLIAGMLSAYDLLKSGLFPNPYKPKLVAALLKQATVLADKVAYSFDTPTGLSAGGVMFKTNKPVYGTANISGDTHKIAQTAQAGTYILEWNRLSDLTGNETYRRLAQRANNHLINPEPAIVFAGLPGSLYNGETGRMLTFDGGWHSNVDSFMEYLIKSYQYKRTKATTSYKDFWVSAVNSTIKHLAMHPHGFQRSGWTYLATPDVNGSTQYQQDDFSCFAGGNFLLGGKILGSQQMIDLGAAVTSGCIWTYRTTTTGLGPFMWAWYNGTNQTQSILDTNDAAERRSAKRYGYYIPVGKENWELRPEVIESTFYAHRISGDAKWADEQWKIFQAIESTAKTDFAYAMINNVNMPFGGTMSDYLDSFFFAEVLKYLYLTFTDPTMINLDQFVFNTEGHPLLVQCGFGPNHNHGT